MNPIWPNCFIVGAMKAGTTSVASALSYHSQVFLCPVKEPNYFCFDLYLHGLGAGAQTSDDVLRRVRSGEIIQNAYIRDRDCYLALFESCGSRRVVVECSTTYLYSRTAADNIFSDTPASKILIILRNPIQRAFSEFLMNCSIGTARPPFSSALDLEERDMRAGRFNTYHRYVSAGLYWKQVERYLRVFGRDRVIVLRFEEMQHNFQNFMARIWEFLELPSCPLPDEIKQNTARFPKAERLNNLLEVTGLKELIRREVPQQLKNLAKQLYYRKPPADLKLTEEDKTRLKRIFRPDVAGLSELLGEDLRCWLD